MATWAVYHLIHVQTPHLHIPQIVIEKVPDDVEIDTDLLERAGYQFGEFGIPWANHVIEEVKPQESPSDLVARIRQDPQGYDSLAYDELVRMANAPV